MLYYYLTNIIQQPAQILNNVYVYDGKNFKEVTDDLNLFISWRWAKCTSDDGWPELCVYIVLETRRTPHTAHNTVSHQEKGRKG